MTAEEIRYIKLHYYKDTPREIAEHLGRDVNNVRAVARKYGLYRGKTTEMSKCVGCQLCCNGVCIFHNEGESEKCKVMRYTHAEWPRLMSDYEIRRMIL